MSCGLTPEMARMLEQMAAEKDRHASEAQQALEATTQHAARVKQKLAAVENKHQKQAQASGGDTESSAYDWTRTYEKWDAWEDPEELARKEQEARERSERAAKAHMGCNHDHSAEQRLMDMTTLEKLTTCDEFRVLGNLFFQHGQYQRAAYHYHKAIVYFEYVFPDTEDEEARSDALKLKLLLNFAACRLKTLHLDDAVHHANQALELDPTSIKALYRRAQAYRLKDEFELASQDITRAMELSESTDPVLTQEKALLQAKMLAYKLKTRELSAAMFGGDKPRVSGSSTPTSAYVPGLRAPDASSMALDLSKGSCVSCSTPQDAAAPSLDSWQPCTRGLTELQALLNQLEG